MCQTSHGNGYDADQYGGGKTNLDFICDKQYFSFDFQYLYAFIRMLVGE